MTTLSVSQFIEDPELQVELKLFAGKAGLARQITAPRIQKPGLALAGFLDLVSTSRVQILGAAGVDDKSFRGGVMGRFYLRDSRLSPSALLGPDAFCTV